MDPDVLKNISKGTLLTSCLGSAVGFSYGAFLNQPWTSLIIKSALNSSLVGFTFFGTRELIISPILVSTLPFREYKERRLSFGVPRFTLFKPPAVETSDAADVNEAQTWADIRKQYVLDTCLAGGMSGALLNGMRGGGRAVLPGAFTASLFCTVLQYAYNEAYIQRVKYISSRELKRHQEALNPSPPRKPMMEAVHERWDRINEKMMRAWKEFLPRKLTEEEYQELLQRRGGKDGDLKNTLPSSEEPPFPKRPS